MHDPCGSPRKEEKKTKVWEYKPQQLIHPYVYHYRLDLYVYALPFDHLKESKSNKNAQNALPALQGSL